MADRSRSSTIVDDTLTKAEYERYRNGSTPAAEPRRCVQCGKPLRGRQKQACSRECGRKLGGRIVHQKPTRAKRKPPPPAPSPMPKSLVELLESLPAEVSAVEIGGWTCRRV